MIEKKISNSQLVYDAIVSLHAAGETVSRRKLEQVMTLKRSIIDDRVKHLEREGIIDRDERGVYVPSESYPPARVISSSVVYGDSAAIESKPTDRVFSVSRLPDLVVVVDIYDQVLKLIPSELRTLAQMLLPFASGGLSPSIVVIDIGDTVLKLSYQDAAEVARMLAPYAMDAYMLQTRSQMASDITNLTKQVRALQALSTL